MLLPSNCNHSSLYIRVQTLHNVVLLSFSNCNHSSIVMLLFSHQTVVLLPPQIVIPLQLSAASCVSRYWCYSPQIVIPLQLTNSCGNSNSWCYSPQIVIPLQYTLKEVPDLHIVKIIFGFKN